MTGKSKIVKCDGCYHGHADSLLVQAGSGAATFGIADSEGVPEELARLTFSISYNDANVLENVFKKHGAEIACFILEPVPANMGVVLPKPGYLKKVRELAKKYGFLAEFNLSIAHLINSDKNAEYKGNDEEIKEALSKIIDYKKRGYPILFSKKAFEYSLSWPTYQVEAYYNNPPAFEHAKCTAGKYFCIFDTNGDVYPCPHLIGKYKPVNAVKEGFKKAFVDLDRHNCKACYQVYHNEFNLLFHLDFSIICNYIKNSLQAINFRN